MFRVVTFGPSLHQHHDGITSKDDNRPTHTVTVTLLTTHTAADSHEGGPGGRGPLRVPARPEC